MLKRAYLSILVLAPLVAAAVHEQHFGGRAWRRRPWRPGRARRRRRRPAGRHRQGLSTGRAGRHRRGRERRSLHQHFGPFAGHRPAATGLLPRRGHRQERRPALHDRPAAARIRAAAGGGQSRPRSGVAQSGRSAAHSRRRQRGVSAAHGRAPGAARGPRHCFEGRRRAGARRSGRDRGVGESRQGGDRKREGAARGAAVSRRQRQGAAQLHTSSGRPSTGAPATTP